MRYLLNLAGVHPLTYWLAHLAADFFFHALTVLVFVLQLEPLNLKYVRSNWQLFAIVMLSFGFSLISLTYMMSHAFNKVTTAIKTLGLSYLLIGYISPLLLVLGASSLSDSSNAFMGARYFLLLDPFIPFLETLIYIVVS
jgi:hypothetical protein